MKPKVGSLKRFFKNDKSLATWTKEKRRRQKYKSQK